LEHFIDFWPGQVVRNLARGISRNHVSPVGANAGVSSVPAGRSRSSTWDVAAMRRDAQQTATFADEVGRADERDGFHSFAVAVPRVDARPSYETIGSCVWLADSFCPLFQGGASSRTTLSSSPAARLTWKPPSYSLAAISSCAPVSRPFRLRRPKPAGRRGFEETARART
jgi:hypothetical protein